MHKLKNWLKNALENISILKVIERTKASNNKRRTNRLSSAYIKNTSSPKLQIGCGGNILSDWMNVDLYHLEKEAMYMDATKPFPLPSNSFDYVFSEHLFEHLDLDGQINYVKESFRILKPGGVIRIATPDFDFLSNLTDKTDQTSTDYIKWFSDMFYPDHKKQLGDEIVNHVYVTNFYFHSWGHKFIQSKETLGQLIAKFGFNNVTEKAVSESDHESLKGLEKHYKEITDRFNTLETVILEGVKPSVK